MAVGLPVALQEILDQRPGVVPVEVGGDDDPFSSGPGDFQELGRILPFLSH